MSEDIKQRLKANNIDPESIFGQYLIKIDEKYQEIEAKEKELNQLKEDVEMMEMWVMYKFNKSARKSVR